MGNIIGKCLRKDKITSLPTLPNIFEVRPLKEIEDIKIPLALFLCTKCDDEIPEILSIHSDNNNIEFKCKSNGIKEEPIKTFLDEIASKYKNCEEKCQNCEEKYREEKFKNPELIQKVFDPNNIESYKTFRYCFECKQYLCQDCFKEIHEIKDEGNNEGEKLNSQKQPKIKIKHKDKNISYIKTKSLCLKHNREFAYFCEDCNENCCEKDNEHNEHLKKPLSNFIEEALQKKHLILEKIKSLAVLLKYNQKILKDSNIESQNNLVNSIKEESDRNDSKQFKLIMTYIERKNKKDGKKTKVISA